jgi:hypothetical protein
VHSIYTYSYIPANECCFCCSRTILVYLLIKHNDCQPSVTGGWKLFVIKFTVKVNSRHFSERAEGHCSRDLSSRKPCEQPTEEMLEQHEVLIMWHRAEGHSLTQANPRPKINKRSFRTDQRELGALIAVSELCQWDCWQWGHLEHRLRARESVNVMLSCGKWLCISRSVLVNNQRNATFVLFGLLSHYMFRTRFASIFRSNLQNCNGSHRCVLYVWGGVALSLVVSVSVVTILLKLCALWVLVP